MDRLLTLAGAMFSCSCATSTSSPAPAATTAPVLASALDPVEDASAPTTVTRSRFAPVLRVIQDQRQPIRLFAFGNELLVDAGIGPIVTRNGVLDLAPGSRDGLSYFHYVSGTASDGLIAGFVSEGNIGWGAIFRHENGWKPVGKSLNQGWQYLGISDFGEGRKIALVAATMYAGTKKPDYFSIVDGKKAKLPNLTLAKPGGTCRTRVQPDAFIGFPSGRLFVYGALCDTDEPGLESFEPGKPGVVSVVEAFKGEGCAKLGVDCDLVDAFFEARGDNDVFLVQTRRIVHFDGMAWKPFEGPATEHPIVALSAAGEHLWLVAAKGGEEVGELWHKQKNAAWARELLPELPPGPLENRGATDVVAIGDTVWVAAEGHVLRTGYSGKLEEVRRAEQ
jgi:hypothetical protein